MIWGQFSRDEVAHLLRTRREHLLPSDVGLPSHGNRRAPGLRREEVAGLAAVSPDYLARLEQRRSTQPSMQVVNALSKALRLSQEESLHLARLCGHQPTDGAPEDRHVEPGLLFVMDRLRDIPAQVISDMGDLLAQNPLAEALFGCMCTVEGRDRNIVWKWFTDPSVRQGSSEEEESRLARTHVADLRAALGRRTGAARRECEDLVGRLSQASQEFALLWDSHDVESRSTYNLKVKHPDIGVLDLDCQVLVTTTRSQRLLAFVPHPGSRAVTDLKLLAAIGWEQFGPANHGPKGQDTHV